MFTGEQEEVRMALEGLLDFMHVIGGCALRHNICFSPQSPNPRVVPDSCSHLPLHSHSESPARSKMQPDSPAFSIATAPDQPRSLPWLPLHPTYSHTKGPQHFYTYHPTVLPLLRAHRSFRIWVLHPSLSLIFSNLLPWASAAYCSPVRYTNRFLWWDFPGCSDSKETACNLRDPGLIPGSGRSPGDGNGDPGDDRGWDGWMASLTRWTGAWANSGRWWWTGKPGMLQSMGSQGVRHNWVTEQQQVFLPGESRG